MHARTHVNTHTHTHTHKHTHERTHTPFSHWKLQESSPFTFHKNQGSFYLLLGELNAETFREPGDKHSLFPRQSQQLHVGYTVHGRCRQNRAPLACTVPTQHRSSTTFLAWLCSPRSHVAHSRPPLVARLTLLSSSLCLMFSSVSHSTYHSLDP